MTIAEMNGFGSGVDFGDDDFGSYGQSEAADFGGLFSGIGKFVKNAVNTAGREIGKAGKTVGGAVSHIPVVGAPVHTVFNAAYHAATAPVKMTVDIAHGKRIDKAALGTLKTAVNDVKAVAPYAQTVVSFVPGVGSGVGAALGAGLALANGQPIDKALVAGVSSAIPGGPLARAAFEVAHQGVTAAASGKKFNIAQAAQTGLGGAIQSLGLPAAAANAIQAGVHMTGEIARGERLDNAIANSAINALPVNNQIKSAMHSASDLSLALAQGKRVDKTVINQVKALAKVVPIDPNFEKGLQDIIKKNGNPSTALSAVLHTAVADGLLKHGTAILPPAAKNAVKTGIALGTGVVQQNLRAPQLIHAEGKLIESGIQLAKTVPAVAAARKLASRGLKGFDLASGLVSQQVKPFDIVALRNKLSAADKKGFDMALALRTGLVASPAQTHMSADAQAGAAITHGVQGNNPQNQKSIIATLKNNPGASVGTAVAQKAIAEHKTNWIVRLLHALGIR